jgi:hypothetical protein
MPHRRISKLRKCETHKSQLIQRADETEGDRRATVARHSVTARTTDGVCQRTRRHFGVIDRGDEESLGIFKRDEDARGGD